MERLNDNNLREQQQLTRRRRGWEKVGLSVRPRGLNLDIAVNGFKVTVNEFFSIMSKTAIHVEEMNIKSMFPF